jgi:hypothetical protein
MLREFDFNLSATLSNHKDTSLGFGSEFKPPHLLDPIFLHHPLWKYTSNIILNGASYPLREISNEDCLQDINLALTRGNHKSAITDEQTIRKLLQEDIKKGFSLYSHYEQ